MAVALFLAPPGQRELLLQTQKQNLAGAGEARASPALEKLIWPGQRWHLGQLSPGQSLEARFPLFFEDHVDIKAQEDLTAM